MALSKSILDRIFKIFVKHSEDIDSDANGVLIAGRTATGKGKMPLLDSDGHIQVDILSGGGGADPAREDKQDDIIDALKLLDTTKVIETELLAISTVAADAQQKSSVLDVSLDNQACVFIDHARDAAAAFVGAGTEYRIEVSQKATGNDAWRTLYSVVCGIAAASSIVMDAEEAAGQTVIEIGATTPALGDVVFFENGTIANSEWGKVVAISAGVSFTLEDGLTNTQAAITLFNKAEQFALNISLKTAKRLRVIVNNANSSTSQNIVSRIACITS